MTACGICVCATPEIAQHGTDICTKINETHVVCSVYGFVGQNPPSFWGAFMSGAIIATFIIGGIIIIRYITTPENGDK